MIENRLYEVDDIITYKVRSIPDSVSLRYSSSNSDGTKYIRMSEEKFLLMTKNAIEPILVSISKSFTVWSSNSDSEIIRMLEAGWEQVQACDHWIVKEQPPGRPYLFRCKRCRFWFTRERGSKRITFPSSMIGTFCETCGKIDVEGDDNKSQMKCSKCLYEEN